MAFMRFPIDAVFLDRDLRVVKIAADLKPWRAAGSRGAKAVLEIPAGEAGDAGSLSEIVFITGWSCSQRSPSRALAAGGPPQVPGRPRR